MIGWTSPKGVDEVTVKSLMAARNISEVRAAFARAGVSGSFAAGFAGAYFGQAFGVLPKAEIDLLVFRLLIESKVIDPEGAIFAIARAKRHAGQGARPVVPISASPSRRARRRSGGAGQPRLGKVLGGGFSGGLLKVHNRKNVVMQVLGAV